VAVMSLDLLNSRGYWELIRRRAQLTPHATMLVEPSGRRTRFIDYADAAERLAAALHAQGIVEGSWVTWQFPTGRAAALLIGALVRLGAVQNPIIHLYREREVGTVLRQSGSSFFIVPPRIGDWDSAQMARALVADMEPRPKLLVLDEDALPQADIGALPAPPTDNDQARWVFCTSGTTADPKGAMHADVSVISAGRGLAQSYALTPADVGALAFPIAHVGGAMYLAELLVSGASALLMPRFAQDEAVELFRRHGVTACGGSTAHYQAFVNAQARQPGERLMPKLRVLGGGGAPKPPELYYRAKRELGVSICHTYGMTECPCITIAPVDSNDEQLAYTDGIAQPDVELRIVGRDGEPAPVGVEGEIRIRGAGVFKRYTDPALTASAFDDDGFFRTGDLGVLRGDGRLSLTGRIKDVIIRKGENISARELEDLLSAHPSIGAVAVIGLPDAERGERVCAVVELAHGVAGFSFEQMTEHFAAAGLMRQKFPEQLEVVERMPRNETLNKILKNKLRELYAAPPVVRQ
jgi:cyclohexanecarboxylate-CoA ligase